MLLNLLNLLIISFLTHLILRRFDYGVRVIRGQKRSKNNCACHQRAFRNLRRLFTILFSRGDCYSSNWFRIQSETLIVASLLGEFISVSYWKRRRRIHLDLKIFCSVFFSLTIFFLSVKNVLIPLLWAWVSSGRSHRPELLVAANRRDADEAMFVQKF